MKDRCAARASSSRSASCQRTDGDAADWTPESRAAIDRVIKQFADGVEGRLENILHAADEKGGSIRPTNSPPLSPSGQGLSDRMLMLAPFWPPRRQDLRLRAAGESRND
jgi:hypothetical protein